MKKNKLLSIFILIVVLSIIMLPIVQATSEIVENNIEENNISEIPQKQIQNGNYSDNYHEFNNNDNKEIEEELMYNEDLSTYSSSDKNINQESEVEDVSVKYSSHIQDYGWELDFSKMDGGTSGTTGESKRIESIKINLNNASENVHISYQTHIQNIGWQEVKSDGEMAGTTGQSLRLEAIKIKAENLEGYAIEYRVHIQDIGWQKWKRNGAVAGTEGQSKRIEAIQIRITKNEDIVLQPEVQYQAHIQDIGWQEEKKNGAVAGTISQSKRLETIKIKLDDVPSGVSLKYRTHIQDIGWQSWKTNNQNSGTEGQSKRIEAIQIEMNGWEGYSIEYRVHVQDIGWMAWVSDGTLAGTTGMSKRIEAIQIRIVESSKVIKSELIGIDVSEHNGIINWDDVKASGINFAIIRCGYGKNIVSQDDKYFYRNITECERVGIPYGVYIYSYAANREGARSEADHVLRLLNGRMPTMGVWIDMEDADGYKTRNKIPYTAGVEICDEFCNIFESRGYYTGIYASLSWLETYLNSPTLDKYNKWVAQWNTHCTYKKSYDMWQYSSDGSVTGINGRTDMNKFYYK